jgi:hypothetical protein
MEISRSIGPWQAAILVSLLAVIGAWPARADRVPIEREIAHLMDYIGASTCRFVRNGREYDAAAARAHIQMKYDHVRARILSAEDFIRYAASESSMSGAPYLIRCGPREMFCADWLAAELERYRRDNQETPGERTGRTSSPQQKNGPDHRSGPQ